MSIDDDAKNLLSDAEKFLHQVHELYGDVLFNDPHVQETVKQSAPSPLRIAPVETELFGGTAPAPSSLPSYPTEDWTSATSLDALNAAICACQKCSLGATRTKFVFGVGNPAADLLVIGEAPGADEDLQGEPFVGRAGQLLNKILEAIHFKREEVFICNILKCRPPNNREPQPDEIELCEPYLWKQIELIRPKLILCAGRVAGQAILKTKASLAQMRGTIHEYRGIPLMVTYHPAALLRNPNWKRPCWEDVQALRKLYDDMKANGWKRPS